MPWFNIGLAMIQISLVDLVVVSVYGVSHHAVGMFCIFSNHDINRAIAPLQYRTTSHISRRLVIQSTPKN